MRIRELRKDRFLVGEPFVKKKQTYPKQNPHDTRCIVCWSNERRRRSDPEVENRSVERNSPPCMLCDHKPVNYTKVVEMFSGNCCEIGNK